MGKGRPYIKSKKGKLIYLVFECSLKVVARQNVNRKRIMSAFLPVISNQCNA